ncbi:MAG TPA: response regulator [Ramlibacter sp.]|nr:response regulator [Ramlibacter sp.]
MTASHISPPGRQVPRILVVDDTSENLLLMSGLFEDSYEVLLAPSGRAALDIVMSAQPPDMILLDIMMPDMDGYEVLRRIRQHPPTANIPIVFLTALAGAQDERLGRDLGAEDYLTKPVDPEQVLARVEGHVRHTVLARRIEALSEKLARHLAPQDWQHLFQGVGRAGIAFEQKPQTVLHVESASVMPMSEMQRRTLQAELGWLATRHRGTVDHFVYDDAVVFFDDPGPCLRMATALLRGTAPLQLRLGVYTGICDIGIFRAGPSAQRTLIGPESWLAAKVAATAAIGGVALCTQTAAWAQQDADLDMTIPLGSQGTAGAGIALQVAGR